MNLNRRRTVKDLRGIMTELRILERITGLTNQTVETVFVSNPNLPTTTF